MKKWLATLLIVWLHGALANGGTPQTTLSSGIYENLMLAVDKDSNSITGFYESDGGGLGEKIGGPSHWTCSFYFAGKLVGLSPWKIVATANGPNNEKAGTSKGFISPTTFASQPALILKLEKPLPGCARGEDLAAPTPTARSFEKNKKWIEIRMVTAKKARFYKSETSARPSKTYVTVGDIVTVYKRSENRVQAEFVAEKKTKGWLLERDLFPLTEQ